MIYRCDIFTYVNDNFNTKPDYPWAKSPDSAVFRHKDTGKWYGVLMNVSKNKLGLSENGNTDILNLKCDPELIGSLRSENGILPAYHMNKEHWVTIVLDSPFPKEDIYNLINLSYNLTK